MSEIINQPIALYKCWKGESCESLEDSIDMTNCFSAKEIYRFDGRYYCRFCLEDLTNDMTNTLQRDINRGFIKGVKDYA